VAVNSVKKFAFQYSFFSEIKKILTMIYGAGVLQLAQLVRMKLFLCQTLNNLGYERAFVNLISPFPMQ